MEKDRTGAALEIAVIDRRCTKLVAEAAVMLEAIEFAISCEEGYCPTCERTPHSGHDIDCKLHRSLRFGGAPQARKLLDVVARARELEHVLTQENLRGRFISQKLYDAHFNLVGALAVYDDKGKKELADGEVS
jgi:hypothetical protein